MNYANEYMDAKINDKSWQNSAIKMVGGGLIWQGNLLLDNDWFPSKASQFTFSNPRVV